MAVPHGRKMQELERMQQGEITENLIYSSLAKSTGRSHNRSVLARIAADEMRHYTELKRISGRDFTPDRMKVRWYTFLGRTLGLAFALKLMEGGEERAQTSYSELAHAFPAVGKIIRDEEAHEAKLIDLISEERLDYASSIVLGLNDALVELTGALAGLTLAFQDSKMIAVSGLIIGIAAALSMAASSYLSSREDGGKSSVKAALYTGTTYMLTVALLITPYFVLPTVYAALAAMMAIALIVIACYTFYISTAKGQRFLTRFAEMALISLGVAAISFGIGFLARTLFGIGA